MSEITYTIYIKIFFIKRITRVIVGNGIETDFFPFQYGMK